jgi:hypothetical protein
MADLTLTTIALAANASTPPTVTTDLADDTIALAAAIWADASDQSKMKNADANLSALGATVRGLALTPAVAGQWVSYITAGDVDLGSALLTMGVAYVLSRNAGKICPIADLASGDFLTIVGYPVTTQILRVRMVITGIQKP